MDNNLGKSFAGTFATSNAVLATAGAVATYATTGIVQFSVKGKAATPKAAVTGGVTPTLDGNTGVAFLPLAINKGCAFVWGMLLDGTVKLFQGPIVDLDSAGNLVVAPEFPGVPDNVCPFGYSIAKNGATGAPWTIGTSLWNAVGMTFTTTSVLTLPARPQIA